MSNPTINDNLISKPHSVLIFPTVYGNPVKAGAGKNTKQRKNTKLWPKRFCRRREAGLPAIPVHFGKRKLFVRAGHHFSKLSKARREIPDREKVPNLENATSSVQYRQIQNELEKNQNDIKLPSSFLQTFAQHNRWYQYSRYRISSKRYIIAYGYTSTANNPIIQYLQQEIQCKPKEKSLWKKARCYRILF